VRQSCGVGFSHCLVIAALENFSRASYSRSHSQSTEQYGLRQAIANGELAAKFALVPKRYGEP
jgi:hypothetical protein